MNPDLLKALIHAKQARQALGQANVRLHLDAALDDCDRLLRGLEDDIVSEARQQNIRQAYKVRITA